MTAVDQNLASGGVPVRGATGAEPVRGRTDVRERVYRTVTEQASATLIGVPRGDVKVDVAERVGGIAVRVSAPLPVPALDDTAAIAAALPVIEQGRRLQDRLREDLARLFGRDVVRIDLVVTGARVPERRRVR
ncbi:hypothetical protein [uncultured Microbacterium sp.]|uniref:hypothetical protein n=1 Tax=uncultured Microbacterium sp. TaxID=191216 RepID=UPI0028DC67D0|nr:hypothetical protein [uncultured Microbacterium sp.]